MCNFYIRSIELPYTYLRVGLFIDMLLTLTEPVIDFLICVQSVLLTNFWTYKFFLLDLLKLLVMDC